MPIYWLVGIFAVEMSTRNEIIRVGDELIRDKGYNAFSFYTIAKALSIRNASIHYYFPTKISLAIAIVDEQIAKLELLMEGVRGKDPLTRLQAYMSTYTTAKCDNKVCLVGSLATDINSVDPEIREALRVLVAKILDWVTDILRDGQKSGFFTFKVEPRTKALMVITNMLASLQLTRLTEEADFETIKETLIKELTT